MPRDPRYAAGQVVNGRTVCGTKEKNGDPCGASPPKGGLRCGNHGGKSSQAKKAAERRLAEQEAAKNMEYFSVMIRALTDIAPSSCAQSPPINGHRPAGQEH